MADWRWSEGVCVRYYVLHWFYAEVYHILELFCIKQVEALQAKRSYLTKADIRP